MGYPVASDELKVIEAEVTGRQYPGYRQRHQFLEVGPGGVVQPGNSGGPALDRQGKVVGVPTIGTYRGTSGWLIPANVIKAFISRIRDNELGKIPLEIPELGLRLRRNFSGTSVWAGAPEEATIFELGVVVREVPPDTMAARWGIKRGDIIVGFANEQQRTAAALDFEGYRVTTGKMAVWPQGDDPPGQQDNTDRPRIHLEEMIFLSDAGDDVTLWYIRPESGEAAGQPTEIRTMKRKVEIDHSADLPNLALYEKPDYELWGDFVVQEFNAFNTEFFDVPKEEIAKGGVLVTFVESSSLASRRGIWIGGGRSGGQWFIIDKIDDRPVRSLADFRQAIAAVERGFAQLIGSPGYQPERRMLLKERYTRISGRKPSSEDEVIRLTAAFPIDEALECTRASGKPKTTVATPAVKPAVPPVAKPASSATVAQQLPVPETPAAGTPLEKLGANTGEQ
jgi:hypothetical protein